MTKERDYFYIESLDRILMVKHSIPSIVHARDDLRIIHYLNSCPTFLTNHILLNKFVDNIVSLGSRYTRERNLYHLIRDCRKTYLFANLKCDNYPAMELFVIG